MQNDLFEIAHLAGKSSMDSSRSAVLDKVKVTLRLDQLIVISIIFLVLHAVIFSIGVEKGKSVSKASEQLYSARLENLKKSHPVHTQIDESKTKGGMGVPDLVSNTAAGSNTKILPPLNPVSDEPLAVVKHDKLMEDEKTGYTIQAVTYKTQKAADKMIETFKNKGHDGFIIPSGKYLQVCVNRFVSKQDASKRLAELKSSGIVPMDAYVRGVR